MRQIITDENERVSQFVAKRIGLNRDFASYTTVGLEKDGELIAGVIYTEYNVSNIVCHIGAVGKQWLDREYLWYIFYYPFMQMKVNRITVVVESDNFESQRFVKHLGFELEATLKDAGRSGDLLIYRMFKKDCRFLEKKR